MTITARTPLLLLLASLAIVCAGCGSSVRPGGDGATRKSGRFPGASQTQHWGGDVASGVCPLAARNRYLPLRSGCVTVLRADVAGDGRDLILLYSRLSHERAAQIGMTGRFSSWYVAAGAFLRVLRARGRGATARIAGASVAAIVAAAHVNDDPGDELFLQTQEISSGSTAVAYGFHDGSLVPAGVTLGYGGDSATKAGFDCLTGDPPRLVQRSFELDGPTIYAWWTDTDVTYAWHGPRLIQITKRTFKRRGLPPASETEVGPGCIAGIESYPAGTSGVTAPANAPTPAAVAVSTARLGHGGLISAVARWHGRLYAAGSDYGTSRTLDCSPSCEPVVWVWSSHPRRWQPVFANQNPSAGGMEFLLSTRSALLLFTTGDGTRLWRSTNGRRYTTVALPPAMAAGTLASTYLSNGTIVAVLGPGTPPAFDSAPVVWTSANGIAWHPATASAGPVVALRLAGPLAVAPNGSLYVADVGADRVLVRLADGRFLVVAGDGRVGFSGDGGLAVKAELYDVSDLAFAPDGALYIADGGRIRMVDRDGVIRTVAGNGRGTPGQMVASGTPALSAALGSDRSIARTAPLSIAFSPSGQLYISTGWQILRLTAGGRLDAVHAVITSGRLKDKPFNSFGPIAIDRHGNIDVGGTTGGWSTWQVNLSGVAHEVSFARGSGGTYSVLRRGPGGAVYGEDGGALVRVEPRKLVPVYSFKHRVHGEWFPLTYFAFAPGGAVYIDDLPPNDGVEAHQQLVKLTNRRVRLLWQQTNKSPQ